MLDKHKRIVNKKAIDKCKQRQECEVCGCPGNDPHHVITRGAGGPDHDYNLICLCRNCHRKAHDGNIEKYYLFEIISNRECLYITEQTIFGIMRK